MEEVEECTLSNPPRGRVMGTRIIMTDHWNINGALESDNSESAPRRIGTKV